MIVSDCSSQLFMQNFSKHITMDGQHSTLHLCSVLAISDLGAKHDFEIWAFKVFFLWTPKAPLRMASRGSDLNIKMGQNTQEIHHKA